MKQINGTEFQTEVLGSPQPVLVDFYTNDCPPCRMMAPVLQEMETEANGLFKVVKVDAAAETELAASYRVTAVPTFLAFVGGKCVAQTMGSKSKANMRKWLEESIRTA